MREIQEMLLARALQGLGTSATRVIATSIVRDCYAGRRMASVMLLAMMVFIAVPVVAPSFGQAVMLLTQWRGIQGCRSPQLDALGATVHP